MFKSQSARSYKQPKIYREWKHENGRFLSTALFIRTDAKSAVLGQRGTYKFLSLVSISLVPV